MSFTWKRSSSRFTEPARRRRRGYSLMETLVSAALVAIVMTGVYALLQAGMDYLRATNTAVELQQQSLLATVWLTREIGESSPRSVSRLSNPNGLLFASPRDDAGQHWVDESGALRWPKFVAYYQEQVGDVPCLQRKEQYMDDPDLHIDPPPLLAPLTQAWQTGAYYRDLEIMPHTVARYVTHLEFVGTNPLGIRLEVSRKEKGRDFRILVQAKVTMKN